MDLRIVSSARHPAQHDTDQVDAARTGPQISIVVPTRNEAGNIRELVQRIERACASTPFEVLFVDDSDDETPERVRAVAAGADFDVLLIHRDGSERHGGLGGAVVEGMRHARAPWVCVMDADLQHPPEILPDMLRSTSNRNVDLVVASRYCGDHADARGFGRLRALSSLGTTFVAKTFFPSRLNGVTDPMSGFFLVRRSALEIDDLRPNGFKILLEILVRTPHLRVTEVPFQFGTRLSGDSKASVREAMRYVSLLAQLRFSGGSSAMLRFMLVGLTGIGVNTALLAAFTELAGIHYLISAALATQGSTAWNFVFTELWVFRGREHGRSALMRFGSFWVMNNIALWLRGPALWFLTATMGVQYLLSNLMTLAVIVVARYAFADLWIWKGATSRGEKRPRYAYDIHGIISIASDARLPELERFQVGAVTSPTIVLHIGKVDTAIERANRVTRRLCYDEGLGPLGFGMTIEVGDHIEVVASQLLKRSPHVLYTNVIEPILRWLFVEKGYALVHGACVAVGNQAYLITARTDTGKTTTMLKTLDSNPWAFMSDDLTLITPEGIVLTYPKPMTISLHTVHAVKKPVLRWWERFFLIFQSRLHSRSGRIFAMIIAKSRLPVATVNTVVQLLVPPPKYHVERLVPGVQLARHAELAGLVIIQRGGEGEERLDEAEALRILLENCEDAYGFPPYHTIEHFLHELNGSDLRAQERAVIAAALDGRPCTLMRSNVLDWAERIPGVIEPHAAHEQRHDNVIPYGHLSLDGEMAGSGTRE
ncbi:MAG TPA: glycosyltransferase family 2 protein [Dehalococcoidia bacterium]|nr:glycosyltransferase family 2 protein [Dehalococcoidia bacterium]